MKNTKNSEMGNLLLNMGLFIVPVLVIIGLVAFFAPKPVENDPTAGIEATSNDNPSSGSKDPTAGIEVASNDNPGPGPKDSSSEIDDLLSDMYFSGYTLQIMHPQQDWASPSEVIVEDELVDAFKDPEHISLNHIWGALGYLPKKIGERVYDGKTIPVYEIAYGVGYRDLDDVEKAYFADHYDAMLDRYDELSDSERWALDWYVAYTGTEEGKRAALQEWGLYTMSRIPYLTDEELEEVRALENALDESPSDTKAISARISEILDNSGNIRYRGYTTPYDNIVVSQEFTLDEYYEHMQELEKINAAAGVTETVEDDDGNKIVITGPDAPTYKPEGEVHVDDNSLAGGINTPTPVAPRATTADGSPITSAEGDGYWDGPPL